MANRNRCRNKRRAAGAALVIALIAARTTAAGPYMTGMGMTNMNIFPDGLFPDFSGPLLVGGGYARGLGADRDSGGVLRLGLAMIKFHDVESLAAPAGMLALECLVHFGDDALATIGLMYQHGLGPLMIGSGLGMAVRESMQSTDHGLLISPEVSLPLRVRAHPRFAPSAVLFVRFDLVASAAFNDAAIMGVSFAVW